MNRADIWVLSVILIFALGFIFGCYAKADGVSAYLLQSSRIADDDTYHAGSWEGIQLNYEFDDGLYLFASQETAAMHPMGKGWEYDMRGFGFGIKHKVTSYFNIFGQLGYYDIKNRWGGRKRAYNEAVHYYLNSRYWNGNTVVFDEYSVDNDNAFGGTFGVELTRQLSPNLDIGFVISYRNLKVKETVRGYKDEWRYDETGDAWEYGVSRNHSTINFGIVLRY